MEIVIGGDKYKIQYGEEVGIQILNKVITWMVDKRHSASSCGEGIMQDDNCTIDAAELICDIVDDILQPKYVTEMKSCDIDKPYEED